MSPPPTASDDAPERRWFDDVTAVEDLPADPAASLVSLGYITAALRRSKWFWCATAIVGLLVGSGLYLRVPRTYQASTTLLLAEGGETAPGEAIANDQTLAESHSVAGLALHNLGLQQSVSSFVGSYTATAITDKVLLITASAPSSNEAVRRANVLATEFLTVRADQLLLQQQLEVTALDQQVTAEEQYVRSISKQIKQPSALPASGPQQAQLSALQAQANRANDDLTTLKQAISANEAATKVTTATLIGGSKVLDAASPVLPHSRLKRLALYSAGGFIIGLILSMAIVVLRALISDRLRRRDDVARALGAPVRSIHIRRASRWLPGRRMPVSGPDLQRLVAYLRDAVRGDSRGVAALAIVPVDDPQVAALSVVSLAESYAQQGRRVVVADLCRGGPAAMLLGARGPGVHTVSADCGLLVAAVPDPTEFAPVGPLRPTSPGAQPAVASELAAASASADLLLTLIALDPSVGSEHLATWAPKAIVMVTSGRSSWTKIHAVGEMIRLAGTRLVSAVLVGADKTDESLGVTFTSEVGSDAVPPPGTKAYVEGSFAGGRGGMLSDGPALMLQMDPPDHLGHHRRTGL